MIIPIYCQSCGKPIGHLWFRYLEKVKNFRTKEAEEPEAEAEAQTEAREPQGTPEARALDELLIHRYCCRRMFLCQPDGLVDMVRNRIEN